MAVAREVGLDVERCARTWTRRSTPPSAATFALAEGLEINGTPAFVIGDRVVPGALDLETIKHVWSRKCAGAKIEKPTAGLKTHG